MNRKWIIGIVVGIMLVYLSLFGLSLPKLYALTGDIIKEDWNSIDTSKWMYSSLTNPGGTGCTGSCVMDPAGILKMSPDETSSNLAGRAMVSSKNPAASDQWTVEMKIKFDEWGGTGADGTFDLQVFRLDFTCAIRIRSGTVGISTSQDVWNSATSTTDTAWHVWTVTCDKPATQVKVYRDSILIQTWALPMLQSNPRFALCFYDWTVGGTLPVCHVDYVYMDVGVKPPSGGGGPTTGSISIKAYFNNSYVTQSFSITWPDGSTQTLSAAGDAGYTNTNAPFGSYTISSDAYSGHACTNSPKQFTLSTSATSFPYTFTYAGGGSPGIDPFKDPTVKTVLLVSGVGVTGLSAVMMFVPFRKRYTASEPGGFNPFG